MRTFRILALTAPLTLLAACGDAGSNSAEPATAAAKEAAGDSTIAEGLGGDLSRFAEAAKAAGLDTTLAGPGPYTVFAPNNAAFDKLPADRLQALLKPEARAELTKLLTGHILTGAVLAEDIAKAIDNGKGKTQLMTVGGETLTATKNGDKIVLTDAAGNKAMIGAADDKRSNGVVHQLDSVLLPA